MGGNFGNFGIARTRSSGPDTQDTVSSVESISALYSGYLLAILVSNLDLFYILGSVVASPPAEYRTSNTDTQGFLRPSGSLRPAVVSG